MAKNKNDQLVVGLFPTADGAKAAGNDIKEWDEWDNKDIKLGAMAILTINPETGKIHSDEIGQRTAKKGLGWGTAIGAAVGILSGGLGLIPGMVIGGAAGAAPSAETTLSVTHSVTPSVTSDDVARTSSATKLMFTPTSFAQKSQLSCVGDRGETFDVV